MISLRIHLKITLRIILRIAQNAQYVLSRPKRSTKQIMIIVGKQGIFLLVYFSTPDRQDKILKLNKLYLIAENANSLDNFATLLSQLRVIVHNQTCITFFNTRPRHWNFSKDHLVKDIVEFSVEIEISHL